MTNINVIRVKGQKLQIDFLPYNKQTAYSISHNVQYPELIESPVLEPGPLNPSGQYMQIVDNAFSTVTADIDRHTIIKITDDDKCQYHVVDNYIAALLYNALEVLNLMFENEPLYTRAQEVLKLLTLTT